MIPLTRPEADEHYIGCRLDLGPWSQTITVEDACLSARCRANAIASRAGILPFL